MNIFALVLALCLPWADGAEPSCFPRLTVPPLTAPMPAGDWWGNAAFYGQGVIERVWTHVKSKTMPPCPECVGFAALMEREYIGRKIWVYNPARRTWAGPLYVIDCAARQHLAGRLARDDIVELPYWLAVTTWGMRGRIRVYVAFSPPPSAEWEPSYAD